MFEVSVCTKVIIFSQFELQLLVQVQWRVLYRRDHEGLICVVPLTEQNTILSEESIRVRILQLS